MENRRAETLNPPNFHAAFHPSDQVACLLYLAQACTVDTSANRAQLCFLGEGWAQQTLCGRPTLLFLTSLSRKQSDEPNNQGCSCICSPHLLFKTENQQQLRQPTAVSLSVSVSLSHTHTHTHTHTGRGLTSQLQPTEDDSTQSFCIFMRLQIELTHETTVGFSLHHAGYASHSFSGEESK